MRWSVGVVGGMMTEEPTKLRLSRVATSMRDAGRVPGSPRGPLALDGRVDDDAEHDAT